MNNPTRDPTIPLSDTSVTLGDTMQVAFLQLKGFTVIPWICEDGTERVDFEIQGNRNQIEDEIRAYGDPNEMVSVRDYVQNLKEVKSMMYAMKRIGKGR